MMARRLDLGADVVAIPSRGLVAIHPDLGYEQALGALMATLPDLHPDAAVCLVDQVTPRPRPPRRAPLIVQRALIIAVALTAFLGIGLSKETAVAGARFGDMWAAQMAALGLVCEDRDPDDGARTCTDASRNVYKVRGYVRDDSDLYVLDRGGCITSILVFRSTRAADDYQDRHPNVSMAGTVAVWTHTHDACA